MKVARPIHCIINKALERASSQCAGVIYQILLIYTVLTPTHLQRIRLCV